MRKLLIIWGAVLVSGLLCFAYINYTPAGAVEDPKYDGDCTPTDVVGRCSDKCPPPKFVRGFDKETGAAICGYVTGCPYGDSIPLGPECDKQAGRGAGELPAVQQTPAAAPENTAGAEGWGK